MKDTMNKSARTIIKLCIYLAIIIVIVGIFALLPKIFSSHEMLFQIIAVVLSVLFTAVVTNSLLTAQSESEENKEKNIKIHESRIKAYSSFMQKLWGVLDDDTILKEEINGVRADLLDNLIFYLDNTQLHVISDALDNLYKGVNGDRTDDSKKFEYIKFATVVADNLKEAVRSSVQENKETDSELVLKLWKGFSAVENQFPDKEEIGETEVASVVMKQPKEAHSEESLSNPSASISKRINAQAWHFCELSSEQLDYLESGGKELSLVEYGENWRTDLVKQVKPNDIVFLFRGNKRYSGAFLAKGWRVFEYDENRNVTEITSEGIPPVLPVGQVNSLKERAIQEIVKEYDIYESFKDNNSTSCANVVIDERLCYLREGVENPGGTYRKTISRYFEGYAVKLLEAFKAAKPENAAIIDSRCFEQ